MRLTSLRTRAAALMLVLSTAACGGTVSEAPARPARASARSIELPRSKPLIPIAEVDLTRPLDQRRLREIEKGATRSVVQIETASADVTVGEVTKKVVVGWSDPLSLRPLAPEATRDAEFVWTSLIGGRSVVSFSAAELFDLQTSATLRIGRAGDEVPAGAFADTTHARVPDVLIAPEIARELGLRARSATLIAGIDPAGNPRKARAELRRAVDGRVRPLLASEPSPDTPPPVGQAQGDLIGAMSFRILKNGFIEPDPAWVAANIASGEVPLLGHVTCHRLVFPQLAAALDEIVRTGLDRLIDPDDYGGCYVPRFVERDPTRPLSMHAFGLAVDLNVSGNHFGTKGRMDPRVVRVFERWGFAWGGRWSPPDPMHFELARLLHLED